MSDTSRNEKMAAYRRQYWRRFKTEGKRRVYGTLSQEEYVEIVTRAKQEGRAVFAQIWAESCAYQDECPSSEHLSQFERFMM